MYCFRRAVAGKMVQSEGEDTARAMFNHRPGTDTLGKHYVQTLKTIDLTRSALCGIKGRTGLLTADMAPAVFR